MISALRKRHHKVWTAIGITLPIMVAYVAITTATLGGEKESKLINGGALSDGQLFQIAMSVGHLKLELLSSLKSSATEVSIEYGSDCNQSQFLGTIESKGIYHFDLPKGVTPCSVIISDALRNIKLDQANLTP